MQSNGHIANTTKEDNESGRGINEPHEGVPVVDNEQLRASYMLSSRLTISERTNPIDRAKSGTKRSMFVDDKGVPIGITVDCDAYRA